MKEMERDLEWALKYAREGNRSTMDYRITDARRQALQCNQMQCFEARVREIRKAFYGTGKEVKCAISASVAVANANTNTTTQIAQTAKTDGCDDDDDDEEEEEVHITEVLSSEQLVAKRVQEAESEGKVVTVD